MTGWGVLILIGCTALLTGIGVWEFQQYRWELKLDDALKKQLVSDDAKCAQDKQVTEDSQHDLQKRFNDISAKLNAHKLQPMPKCIIPATKSVSTAGSGPGHASQNGISTDWLRSYAAECEQYRQERIALEEFEDKVWNENGKMNR